jgi:membrane protease subunit HflK
MPDRFGDWPPRRRSSDDPFAVLRDLWTQVRSRLPGGGDGTGRLGGVSPFLIAGILLLVWLASGIYIVAPDERGVVLRFGEVQRETEPGPHWKLPWPFEEVLRPSVTQIRKEEVGFRTIAVGPPARYQEVDAEALMLTGDENIVKLEFIVQYKVQADEQGTTDFLFNVRDPQETVRASAEAAMREVIGRTRIDEVLTEGKERVQIEAQDVMQGILDHYDAGIQVVTVKLQDVDPPDQVNDAFKDVISAQQDKERLINEAKGYANDVVPKARGQAAEMVNEAEGYKEARIREASGVGARFIALQREYEKAKDVTRRRLYLETMEAILPGMDKILLDESAVGETVPYLPIEALKARPAPERPAGGR